MMMDRNREASRRGSMAAVNGALSRRRQRTGSSSLRDSPDDDAGMDLQESSRLRDRGSKKDRDRDRSSRNKRRRGDRLLHGSSNREEGEDSSEESVEDDDDEEDDDHHHRHPSPVSTSAASQQRPVSALGPASSSNPMQSSTSSAAPASNSGYHHSNHSQQHRKSLPAKVVRAPPVWKVADEMIGVSIPRKARSASAKRSPECWVSGSGAGVGTAGGVGGGGSNANAAGAAGEPLIHRQASTSPARPSPPTPAPAPAPAASTTPISPSSSSVSVRKKMKPLSGGGSNNKLRPPKNTTKPPSSVQDIEFEVAEVLFGMTRQFPTKPEAAAANTKAENGTCNDTKSRVSSPNSASPSAVAGVQSSSPALPAPPTSNSSTGPAVVAPKRKRPRPAKLEDETASSQSNAAPPAILPTPLVSSTGKPDVVEKTAPALELPPSKPEKEVAACSPTVDNGPLQAAPEQLSSSTPLPTIETQQEPTKLDLAAVPPVSLPPQIQQVPEPSETKDEAVSDSRQSSKLELDMNCDEASTTKDSGRFESPKGEKFKIDLMAPPPPGKSSPEADAEADFIMSTDLKMAEEPPEITKATEEKAGKKVKLEMGETAGVEKPAEKSLLLELNSKKRPAELSLDVENRLDKSVHSSNNKQQQQPLPKQQHQSKVPKTEIKPDASKVQAGSIPVPMALAGWPGSLPTFGYMGQIPSLPAAFTMDVNAGSAKAPQFPSPQLRLKRCATHCYIAQNICYHQQIMKMQQFWPGAPGAAPVFGAKPPYNLNVMPPSESIMGANPLQQQGAVAAVSVRNAGPATTSQQDKQQHGGGPAVVASFSGGGHHPPKDMNPVANAFLDTFQQKQPAASPQQQPSVSPAAASTSNMLHAPALFFPLGQQQQAAAAAAAASPAVIWSGGAIKPGGGNAGASNATASAPSTHSSASSAVSSVTGSAAPAATTVSFSYGNLPPGEAHYLAILQNNGYPYPIPAHVGAPPPPQYRGNHASHPMPFFNGPFYASHMFPASQLPHQAHPQQQASSHAAAAQQGHQNASTSTGSTSSQKHAQQSRVPGGASTASPGGAAAAHVLLPNMKPTQQQSQRMKASDADAGSEDTPSAMSNSRGTASAPSAAQQGQKAVMGPNFSAIPVHPQDLALISAAAAMGNSSAAAADKNNNNNSSSASQQQQQQNMKIDLSHSQAFAMSFPPAYTAGAVTPAGIDFASMAHNHPMFQSLPEAARQSYHQYAAAAAAAVAAQAAQQKKPASAHNSVVVAEDVKSSAGGDKNADEEKKATPAGGGASSGKQHHHHSPSGGFTTSHSLVGENDAPASMNAILSNSVIDSSSGCNLNLIPSSIQGGRGASNRPPTSSMPGSTTSSVATGTANVLSQQQQQFAHLQQMRQQHQQQQQQQQQQAAASQQQIQIQHQLNSRPKSAAPGQTSSSGFADHFLSSSAMAMAKFSNSAATIGGFPQGIVQSNGPNQSPQWKNMGRPASAVPSPSSVSSSGKNQQQQQHQQQQSSRAAAAAASHAQQQQQQQQQQQAISGMNHQTQISFGSNSLKLPSGAGQQIIVGGGSGNPSTATGSVVASAVGSPQATTALLNNSKNGATGSPRSSSSSMKGGGGPQGSKVSQMHQQHQQQAAASKSSPSNSGHSHSKSSPVNNRNAPSILGQPNNNNAVPPSNSQNSATTKAQQQQQQQLQQQFHQQQQQMHKHQFPASSQLFFSAPFMQQAATHQANVSAAAAAYYNQRRPSEQSQQQSSQGKPSSSTGMLSLSSHPAISLASATVTTDPAKAIAAAAAANNVKMATAAAAAQYAQSHAAAAAAAQHGVIFPYIHQFPSVPVKQAAAGDQNSASGNESLHSCWQPEKR